MGIFEPQVTANPAPEVTKANNKEEGRKKHAEDFIESREGKRSVVSG